MVDRAALEMRNTGNRIGGSNPSLSAIISAKILKRVNYNAREYAEAGGLRPWNEPEPTCFGISAEPYGGENVAIVYRWAREPF